jgi:COP9 signalosome complex subunit 2
MSDSEDYEYEYDESDQEAMDDGGNGDDEEQSFEYTDDEDNNNQPDGEEGGEIALENAYYNAKGERDNDELDEARETFESVVRMEVAQNKKAAGVEEGDEEGGDDNDNDGDAMDVEGVGNNNTKLTPLKYHGSWGYKAIKQLVKLHLRSMDGAAVMKDYARMLRVSSSPDSGVSPNAAEKGVNGMLDRVSNLISQQQNKQGDGAEGEGSSSDSNSDPRVIARNVYDMTLDAFHPKTGLSPNERLWFKTNLKYGQLLYEMNETAKLQLVIRDLLISSGQPTDILEGGSTSTAMNNADAMDSTVTTSSTGGTHVMEIAALQIQLYSRLKDTKKLRAAYHRAMAVRGGIPHPRTLALIQELGGKMHMSQRNFNDASQAFFQAFKSYDEAGDRCRLRCLKYLVMASMLHASSINPFDSHEARAHRDDPEIVAMTNLVQAFHNDDIRKFEKILQKNEGRIMDDEFVREHVADLLRTIRTQVIMRNVGCYTRIRLARISHDLNDIPVEDVENLLVSLILDGKLDGHIDQVRRTFGTMTFICAFDMASHVSPELWFS